MLSCQFDPRSLVVSGSPSLWGNFPHDLQVWLFFPKEMWESDPSSKISSPERQMGLCLSLGMGFTSKSWRDLVAQMVKRLPTIWETKVQSLAWEDLLEKEMAPHSSILAWNGRKNLVGYSPWGHKESDMTEQLHFLGESGVPSPQYISTIPYSPFQLIFLTSNVISDI